MEQRHQRERYRIWADVNLRDRTRTALKRTGFAFVPSCEWTVDTAAGRAIGELAVLWDNLPGDQYLHRGALFRSRRYSRYLLEPQSGHVCLLPQRPYFQNARMNSYAGGLERTYQPLVTTLRTSVLLHRVIREVFQSFPLNLSHHNCPWHIDVHQIRIEASRHKPGYPAPEGVHQDGLEWIATILVRRDGVRGGITVISSSGHQRWKGTLREPGDALLIHDAQLAHYTSPISHRSGAAVGIRDVLLLGYRKASKAERRAARTSRSLGVSGRLANWSASV